MRDVLITGCMIVLVTGMVACAAQEPAATEVSESEEAAAVPQEAPAAVSSSRSSAPAPAPAPARAPAPPAPRVYEVPAGTQLTFTLIDALSTETAQAGQTFQASLTDALVVDGRTLAPRNALATGQVVSVDEPGRVSGVARIELVMTGIESASGSVELKTHPFVAEAEATKGEDATKIGAGAGIGAAIGAALGGGKGAALGAAIGGGGGTAVVLATKGDQVELPSESRLSFELSESLRITPTS